MGPSGGLLMQCIIDWEFPVEPSTFTHNFSDLLFPTQLIKQQYTVFLLFVWDHGPTGTMCLYVVFEITITNYLAGSSIVGKTLVNPMITMLQVQTQLSTFVPLSKTINLQLL